MQETGTRPSDVLTTNDVAKLAGVDSSTVRDWETAGKLPASRTASGVRLFKRGDVERFLRKREDGAR